MPVDGEGTLERRHLVVFLDAARHGQRLADRCVLPRRVVGSHLPSASSMESLPVASSWTTMTAVRAVLVLLPMCDVAAVATGRLAL